MAITELTKDNFESGIENGYTLVDFWAEWCTPCKMLEPIYEELSGEMNGKVSFAKVNVDDNPEIAQKFQVMSIPTMILFKNGELVDRKIGAVPKEVIVDFLESKLPKEEE